MQKQTQIEKQDVSEQPVLNDRITPAKLTPGQNLALTVKVLLAVGSIGGLIWALDYFASA